MDRAEMPPDDLLSSLLKKVSRSFYLTLRILPASIREQIGLAYLLARTTDTIADTGLVPVERRLDALDVLRRRIRGDDCPRAEFGELAGHQASAAERVLLERCEDALKLLSAQAAPDARLIIQVLDTITSGQELDLRRFADASKERILALREETELDDYTYRVAGCVGEFWTKMCLAHVFTRDRLDHSFLLENGVRFGKGLQLVNILRDLPADLRQGRCYVPESSLAPCGLKPCDLLQADREPAFRPVYNWQLAKAEAHLRAGWGYTNHLPGRSVRIRLACAWPILIGLETIRLLRTGKVLDADKRIKISRAAVHGIMLRSVLLYPWQSKWKSLAEMQARAGQGISG